MRTRIWLPLVAAAIFVGASAAIYNLLGASMANPAIHGGIIGLVLAAITPASVQRRLGWLGRLMILTPVVALVRWVVIPLISREPILAGFDGTNPAALVPAGLYLAAFVVVFGSYALVAERRVAAN